MRAGRALPEFPAHRIPCWKILCFSRIQDREYPSVPRLMSPSAISTGTNYPPGLSHSCLTSRSNLPNPAPKSRGGSAVLIPSLTTSHTEPKHP